MFFCICLSTQIINRDLSPCPCSKNPEARSFINPEEMSQKRSFVKALGLEEAPLTCQKNEPVLLERTPPGSDLRIRKSSTSTSTPTKSSPGVAGSPRPKLARRLLKLTDENIPECVLDSGSEGESDPDSEDEAYDICAERANTRRMREEIITALECEESLKDEVMAKDEPTEEVMAEERVIGAGKDEGLEQPALGQEFEGLNDFVWSEDFSSFSGQAESYLRSPGPTVESQDPVEIFMAVFDSNIMEVIVRETNRYAWQIIGPLSEIENGVADSLIWTDTSVSEMYRYFATLILMSMCYRARIRDYWTTDILEMPGFRTIMSRNRFLIITRFLHFMDNECFDLSLSSYDKKISKIRPILDHCNMKFASLYIPNKHLSLDESLLLWKGRLSWVQCIRTKAARFGIKSYELCEAATGYQLRCLLYAGKGSAITEESIYGFESCTAKVVLELMDGFLDVGHTLVMDNWYNQLPLTRFLKRRRTDVIGTINPRSVHIPDDIKQAIERHMVRGQQIARHCGDISLVAWNDVKLVTTVSTCHSDRQLPARRAGQSFNKPEAILEYNKYMGGVDSKDQKLSMYLMERKRGKKWYMKVFKRLLNTSLLNTYIIYTKNPVLKSLSHRDFRCKVALGLLERFPKPTSTSPSVFSLPVFEKDMRRLKKANHFVENTVKNPGKNTHKQLRCVRCTAAGRRTMVTLICSFCNVPLCAGPCWAEYHSLPKLR